VVARKMWCESLLLIVILLSSLPPSPPPSLPQVYSFGGISIYIDNDVVFADLSAGLLTSPFFPPCLLPSLRSTPLVVSPSTWIPMLSLPIFPLEG